MVAAVSSSVSSSRSVSRSGHGETHRVRRGESMWKIARDHGVSLQQLIAANPQVRNPNLIYPGQELNLPARRPASSTPSAETPARARAKPRQPDANGNYQRGGDPKPMPQGVDPAALQAQVSATGSSSNGGLSGVDRIIDYTARTEGGGRYDAWNPNDAGHGVSFGLIQFNQKRGSLPSLFKGMHEANPEKFNGVFGPHAQNLLSESYVRSANLNDPDIKSRMLEAGRDPELQQVQRNLARSDYYEPAAKMAAEHGLTSERAHAMLFDSAVQNGVGGTRKYLRQAAAGGGSERDILRRFANLADDNRYSGNRRTRILHDPNLSDGPVGSSPAASAPATGTQGSSSSTPASRYTVRPGDTLSGIAARHGTTWQELQRLNNIRNPNLIRPGQVLRLPGGGHEAPAGAGGSSTYSVRPGDTLSGIAARHGTTWQELQRLNNIRNPNLIYAGQELRLPGGSSSSPAPSQPSAPVDAPQVDPGRYDGRTPAPGTTNTKAWIPVDAPLQNRPGDRSASQYADVLDQFAVGNNPRYAKRNGNTYCNIFVWDATRAMGAEIPHWVDGNGNPAKVGASGAWEMNANATNRWLHNHGPRHGWRQVSAEEAQRLANQGHPTVASWNNPGGIGHIAMVRPGELTAGGPTIAQAGSSNFNSGTVRQGFGSAQPQYFVHD